MCILIGNGQLILTYDFQTHSGNLPVPHEVRHVVLILCLGFNDRGSTLEGRSLK